MAQTELEKALENLSEALNVTETEVSEEIKVIEQQIEEMKERVFQLNDKQQTLAHDKASIAEMVNRYIDTNGSF